MGVNVAFTPRPDAPRGALALAALLALAACAGHSRYDPGLGRVEPLQTPAGVLTAEQALLRAPSPDLLALNDDMRAFLGRYVGGDKRQRLHTLHSALRSPAMVGITYDSTVHGSAIDAFERGSANCLTYAHLFVSLARAAGLDARYMLFTLRPEWTRHGERVVRSQHVNVLVKLPSGESYLVDIDPVSRGKVASAEQISDRRAFALHHGNLAIDALLQNRHADAYAQAVRSLQLGGDIDYLWVNLGAIFRQTGQNGAARASYMTALDIDADSRPAMNNLVVLSHAENRPEQAAHWEAKVARHRMENPYYHFWLGERAEREGDWRQAVKHYRRAIALKGTDGEFYYRMARLYRSLERYPESRRYARLAVERARLTGDRNRYEGFLKSLADPALAGLPR